MKIRTPLILANGLIIAQESLSFFNRNQVNLWKSGAKHRFVAIFSSTSAGSMEVRRAHPNAETSNLLTLFSRPFGLLKPNDNRIITPTSKPGFLFSQQRVVVSINRGFIFRTAV